MIMVRDWLDLKILSKLTYKSLALQSITNNPSLIARLQLGYMGSLVQKETPEHIIVEISTFNCFNSSFNYGFSVVLACSITVGAVGHLQLQTI